MSGLYAVLSRKMGGCSAAGLLVFVKQISFVLVLLLVLWLDLSDPPAFYALAGLYLLRNHFCSLLFCPLQNIVGVDLVDVDARMCIFEGSSQAL